MTRHERKVQLLSEGKKIVSSERGNSMSPMIHSGQEIEPATWESVIEGDVVFCKVRGRYYTHLVYAKNNEQGVQIGNYRGHINGWTKQVFGKVTSVFSNI